MSNESESIATRDVLLRFGFRPDDGIVSDVEPGLSFDFGNFKLSASWVMNMRFAEVVLFTGVIVTPRTISEVLFELPRRVKSVEQCAAWIAWHLDRVVGGEGFVPAHPVEWFIVGKNHHSLLPWMVDLTEYKARPHCVVERNWLRVALKTLGELLTTADGHEQVVFSFDGTLLTIRSAGKAVAMPAEGMPWPKHYQIPAERLRRLPKRLINDRIVVSVWGTRLNIGSNSYVCDP